ncbi:MAG: hypothetical protein WAN59_03440 [Candidatus Baltobacteraceae bacterium]|jgi:hypothetical protein
MATDQTLTELTHVQIGELEDMLRDFVGKAKDVGEKLPITLDTVSRHSSHVVEDSEKAERAAQ